MRDEPDQQRCTMGMEPCPRTASLGLPWPSQANREQCRSRRGSTNLAKSQPGGSSARLRRARLKSGPALVPVNAYGVPDTLCESNDEASLSGKAGSSCSGPAGKQNGFTMRNPIIHIASRPYASCYLMSTKKLRSGYPVSLGWPWRFLELFETWW